MLEKPDLPDAAIARRLDAAYGLRAAEIAFLPLGAERDTAVYRVLEETGTAYFLKLRRGDLQRTGVMVPRLLHDAGVTQVIPPIPTRSGRLWARLQAFAVLLYPFVEGRDAYEAPMSSAQWTALGAALRGLHQTELPRPLARNVRHDRFSHRARNALLAYLERAKHETFDDPLAAEMAFLLRAERSRIAGLVSRSESLAAALRLARRPAVLCHGDMHQGNVLLDAAGALYVVDWDTLVFAPRERDFEQTHGPWGSEADLRHFHQGYGPVELDQTALAYYRYWRIVEDIAVAGELVLGTSGEGANRRQELTLMVNVLQPGGALDLAHRLDRG